MGTQQTAADTDASIRALLIRLAGQAEAMATEAREAAGEEDLPGGPPASEPPADFLALFRNPGKETAIRAWCRAYTAGALAERERCAQLAEQEAAHTDLQVVSDETRITGGVLRHFAARLRGGEAGG